MRRCFYIIFLLTICLKAQLDGQSRQFIIKMAPFSSRAYDEFSPVFYKGGIVFCSNRSDNSLINYNDGQNRLLKIFYAARRDSTGWKRPNILAKEITTGFNDGPVTFNENGNIIYYSRNNSIEGFLRNISDTSNKLGIYSAELINGTWTNIRPFTYNNQQYSFITPALTPEGERIYFASDIPGGSGGMDLYYCDRHGNDWGQPVNIGPAINTSGSESFPFAAKYGKLFFASDGHKGFGGKDIFYTQEINGKWMAPVHLDSTINSTADDFGFVTDSTFENGYFSTNRLKTDDIFSFSSPPLEFTSCESIRENNYCFTLYDEQHRLIDTIPVIYRWDFGNGIIRIGTEVRHCFPGPGEYSVRLNIIDEITGDTIAKQVEHKVKLENIEQTYINSDNIGIADKPVIFNGIIKDLKDFRATDFLWNFGDGFKQGGPSISRIFKKKGEYTVHLGILGEKDSLGMTPQRCVMKKIRIHNSCQEVALEGEEEDNKSNGITDSLAGQCKTMQISICLMDDLSGQQKARITERLKESGRPAIRFDQYGIAPASFPFLDNIARILEADPDIRLEIVLKPIKDEIPGETMNPSEKWAQEVAFYFKNKDVDMNRFSSKGFGPGYQLLKPPVTVSRTIDGVMEFMFMRK